MRLVADIETVRLRPPGPHQRRLWLVLVCCGLGACAGGTAADLGLSTATSGYALSPAEQRWNCSGLENAIQVHTTKIINLSVQAKTESQNVAPTVARLFTRLADGVGADGPQQGQIRTERAVADAYNDQLKAKGCAKVDIDGRVSKAVAAAQPATATTDLHPKQTGIKPLEAPKGAGF